MFGNNNFGNGFGNGFNAGGFGGFEQAPAGFDAQGFNAGMSGMDFGVSPMMPQTSHGMQTITIRKAYLTMTRRYNNQWRRNYELTATGQTYNSIADAVSQNGGLGLTNEAISGLMADQATMGPSLFSYMGSPEAPVGIENGWDNQRFRFVLVVDVFMNGKYRKTEFISGYTDEPAMTNMAMENSRSVSPNMLFVINNVTEATVNRHHTASGINEFSKISSTNAVIRNENWSLNNNGNLWVMRPEDVLGTIDKLPLLDGMAQASALGETPTFSDLDTTVSGIPKMSARSSDMVTTYASRMINGMITSRIGDTDLMNEDGVGVGGFAATKMRDKVLSRGAFSYVMSSQIGANTSSTGTFTYGDLLRLDPTIDSRLTVFTKAYDDNPALYVPDGNTVSDIADASEHCVAATMISNSIMSLMSQAGITLMVYEASNEFGEFSVVPAFDGMDTDGLLANRVEALKTRMQNEVLNIVTLNGNLSYNVSIIADVFNDVFVKLRLDGEERHYVVPAFSSSHIAPLVTNDQTRLVDFARSMSELVDSCVSTSQQTNQQIFAGPNDGGEFGLGNY